LARTQISSADRARSDALRSGGAHLWQLLVPQAADALNVVPTWLDAAELARAASFHFERDRRLYLASHLWLRKILAAYLGGVDPAALRFEQVGQGKPRLELGPHEAGLRFSLSHTHSAILVGLAWSAEIGVDIEKIQAVDDSDAMHSAVLHPEEIHALQQLPAEQRDVSFHALWTVKEAYTKAIGKGLSHPFPSLSVGLHEGCRSTLKDMSAPEPSREPVCGYWSTLHAGGDSYAVAATVPGRPGPFVVHKVPADTSLDTPLSEG
jgi:4'-phosphopantetheinyl transferase